MGKNDGKGKKKKSHKAYSGIDAHQRQKKLLIPPFMAIPQISLQSWANDRLPEMLWSALLISRLGRGRALECFRKVAGLIRKLPVREQPLQPTLSGLASLEEETLREFLIAICAGAEINNALRPMLLFDDLPAKKQWTTSIGQPPQLTIGNFLSLLYLQSSTIGLRKQPTVVG